MSKQEKSNSASNNSGNEINSQANDLQPSSQSIEVRLQGGMVRSYEAGITVGAVASSISTSLGKQAIGGIVDGQNVDLDWVLKQDCELVIVTLDSAEGLYRYRHSAAHVLAQALKRIYGAEQVKLGIGPVIEDGFYYDVDLEHALSISDLAAIEREMNRIIQENHKISRRVVNREEALRIFGEIQDPYKLELIQDLPEDAELSIYDQGEFFDLCRGPHLPSTGRIKAFKLLNVAGAYWRGTRIIRCCNASTALLSRTKHSWMNICTCSKKRRNGITVNLAKSLNCSCSPKKRPACPFICLKA